MPMRHSWKGIEHGGNDRPVFKEKLGSKSSLLPSFDDNDGIDR